MRNTIWLMSVGTVMCLATAGMAQPRGGERGGPPSGGRPGAGEDRLSAALEKIDARLKELERQVDCQRPATGGGIAPRPGGIAGPMAFGGMAGGGASRPFGPSAERGRGPAPKDGGRGPMAGGPPHRFGPGTPGGFGPGSARGFESRFGSGMGPAAVGQASAERRIDRIIGELEQLKKELRGSRR